MNGQPQSIDDVLRLQRVREEALTGRARRKRIRASLSLADMAGPVGVSPVTIYRWETGERRPTGDAASRYLDLLDAIGGTK